MVETQKSKANLKRKRKTDTTGKKETNYTIVNNFPEYDPKNAQYIEQQLFGIFKKYEKKEPPKNT